VLAAHTRPGDRVAVEDPGYAGLLDLVAALGLTAVPIAVDDAGMLPAALDAALDTGVAALVATPRAQNPTGAALDAGRVRALRPRLRRHPGVVVVEDDHAGAVAGAPAQWLSGGVPARWAVVRSVAKSLGPDLRVALLTGDETTVARVRGRQRVGPGWVSHLLQRTVAHLLADRTTATVLRRAERTYGERRAAMVAALADRGVASSGRSGLNVWVPVADEDVTVAAARADGFAIAPGGRFRTASPPAVRVTIARLHPRDAPAVAESIARSLAPGRATRAG
jgi:DNA-binding transcriptional MocR family regulator